MNLKHVSLLASVGCVALLCGGAPALGAATAVAPNLGTAKSFAVLGGSTVTNTGNTLIYGDLGVWPGLAITGFYPPGIVVPPGTIHAGDSVAQGAQSDLTTAYNFISPGSQPGCTDLSGQDLGTIGTLAPGVYCFSTSAQLTGTIHLNGGPTDVWIFQIGTTLTTASSSVVDFSQASGQACNVFWQVGSSATLGSSTKFAGNILALASITMVTGATLEGRALARNGAVTLDTNTTNATVCAPDVPPPGGVGLFKVFSPPIIEPGGQSTLTITFTNATGAPRTLAVDLVDTLPTGMTTVGSPTTDCGGTPPVFAFDANSLTLKAGAIIPTGTVALPGFCTLSIGVTVANSGSYSNTLPVLQTDNFNSPVPGPGVVLDVRGGIPALSVRAMIALVILLALLGVVVVRRLAT